MSWLAVILLAALALAIAALVLRVPRGALLTLATVLTLGLAGYALQASPDVPAAPAAGAAAQPVPGLAWRELRREMIDSADWSMARALITADAFAARGDYRTAAGLLRPTVAQDPADGEAWLTLANTLVEHADGLLTPPARYAYTQAGRQDGTAVAAGYFLGLAQLRGGDIIGARETWQTTLAAAPADGEGPRALLTVRLARLDELLARALRQPGSQDPPALPPPPAP
ncbi:hypothetical protein V5740_06545 [Croceibacterium sp. TMG7-5b_MA50]|uniref:tetratricopeptide repeat protein n=1 Tax=Croceibacterium sp. TMG7-5b_MA50 TaxID=3121290 RepID=UPI0032221D5C